MPYMFELRSQTPKRVHVLGRTNRHSSTRPLNRPTRTRKRTRRHVSSAHACTHTAHTRPRTISTTRERGSHTHARRRADATHNALARESLRRQGAAILSQRAEWLHEQQGVRAKTTSAPPHTIHRHTRSNLCACMDRGPCKRYARHSRTCMRNLCAPVASARRQRVQCAQLARCDEQHYGRAF